MTNTREPRLSGLTIWAGIVMFFITNTVVYVVANPRFPNQEGPMPPGLPFVVLALLIALVVAAWFHPGWRRVAFGFVVGYVIMTVVYMGACTTVWTTMALGLDTGREARRVARYKAAQDSSWRLERLRRIKEVRSEKGRAYLARTANRVGPCAFAYRDAHPERGFPTSLEEMGKASDECHDFVHSVVWRDFAAGATIGLEPPPPGTTTPVTRLRLSLAPVPNLGIAYPRFEIDERGVLTMRSTGGDSPHVVASPVPALLALRACLQSAVPSHAREVPLGPAAPADTTGLSCAMARELQRDHHELRLDVRVDSRVAAGDRDDPAAHYRVRYVQRPDRPGEGFELRAAIDEVRVPARHYLVAADGSVHATSESREATEADPAPMPCEAEPAIACR